jgi:K+-sensing histidine kinase KdpD
MGPEVEIRIGNSGPAIPVGERSTVFDKYRQTARRAGPMNVGLGLYFCRLAIEAQGGKIWVEQTARLPTLFGIRLPRRVVSAPHPASTEPLAVAS